MKKIEFRTYVNIYYQMSTIYMHSYLELLTVIYLVALERKSLSVKITVLLIGFSINMCLIFHIHTLKEEAGSFHNELKNEFIYLLVFLCCMD